MAAPQELGLSILHAFLFPVQPLQACEFVTIPMFARLWAQQSRYNVEVATCGRGWGGDIFLSTQNPVACISQGLEDLGPPRDSLLAVKFSGRAVAVARTHQWLCGSPAPHNWDWSWRKERSCTTGYCSGHMEGTLWGSYQETLRGRLIAGSKTEQF